MVKNRLYAYGVAGFFLVALLIGIGALGTWVKTEYFEAGGALVTKHQDVDAVMRLNVQGKNLRVYEFTPQTAPGHTCIFVAGTNKASLDCIPKR